MALENENGGGLNVSMPVAPMGGGYNYGGGWGMPYAVPVMGGYGYGNGGFGGFGGDWSALIILFLFAAMFGGGFGGFGMGGFGGFDGGAFPWLLASNANNQNATNAGFDSIGVSSQLTGIHNAVTSGFGDTALGIAGINQNICQTGAGITAAITGSQNALSQQLYTNEIASLNRSFAEQTANTAAINGVQGKLADCCCENRLATANLQSVIQSENCADREAINNGIRDLLTATTAQNQRILDKLCDQELQAERRENDNLRSELMYARGQASQVAQTSRLLADNAAQTQQIENYVRPQINPAYIVPNPYAYNFYPNTGWNGGCNSCGNNGFGFAG